MIAAFPWRALPSVARVEIEGARSLRRAADVVRLDGVARVLGELVKAEVRIASARITKAEPRGADDFVGFTLGLGGERSPAARVLVEVEAALALALASRALERPAPRIPDAARVLPPELAGSIAAIAVAALRRAHAGEAPRVLSAGPGYALLRDLLALAPNATTGWLAVTIGSDAFVARVTVPDALAVATAAPRAWDDVTLAGLGDLHLALPLVVGHVALDRGELAAIAPGDVVVLADARVQATTERALEGRVALIAPRAERGLGCDLANGERLVVRGELEAFGWTSAEETTMSETTSPTVTSLEDAPVVVRVEVGSVELTASAWSELRPGDVLTLGRRLGEPAILRVAGAEVARGELVQVDGEIGVRIVARAGER